MELLLAKAHGLRGTLMPRVPQSNTSYFPIGAHDFRVLARVEVEGQSGFRAGFVQAAAGAQDLGQCPVRLEPVGGHGDCLAKGFFGAPEVVL